MFDLGTGAALEDYLRQGLPEEVARIDVAFSRTSFSTEFEDAVRSISGRSIAAFVELFCPDAAALLPYLGRIGEINELVSIRLFPVKGNEALLSNLTGAAKIPTLMILGRDGLPTGFYVEHPQEFRDRMARLEGEERRTFLRDFREGEMGELIEKDLIRLLTDQA